MLRPNTLAYRLLKVLIECPDGKIGLPELRKVIAHWKLSEGNLRLLTWRTEKAGYMVGTGFGKYADKAITQAGRDALVDADNVYEPKQLPKSWVARTKKTKAPDPVPVNLVTPELAAAPPVAVQEPPAPKKKEEFPPLPWVIKKPEPPVVQVRERPLRDSSHIKITPELIAKSRLW